MTRAVPDPQPQILRSCIGRGYYHTCATTRAPRAAHTCGHSGGLSSDMGHCTGTTLAIST